MECLFSIPIPATAPNASHQSGDAPLMMRTTIQAQSNQKSGSKAFMERKLSKARLAGAKRMAAAAKHCASAAAELAGEDTVSQTTAAPAMMGKARASSDGIAEQVACHPGDEGDQRRLVDIAPGEVLAARL